MKMAPFIKKYRDILFDNEAKIIDYQFLVENSMIEDSKSML